MPENMRDIQKMQLDAERRIREMQRRSDNALRGNEKPPIPNYTSSNPPRYNQQSNKNNQNRPKQSQPTQHPSQNRPPQNQTQTQKSGLFSRFKGTDILKIFNFKNLHIDNDVLIIIALIFLLSTEETDELLLMALIYIML